MSIAQAFIPELEQEAAVTRRVLERVPGNKLDWPPHPKSMSLGQLAFHVATTPGGVSDVAALDEMPVPDFATQPTVESAERLLPILEESVAKAKTFLSGLDDARATADWKVMKDGKPLMVMPRIGLIRGIMLNHWYHHRGQLTVDLRLLDVPVPSVYGPSADESPFA
jgi:uncharacterized damage-inducible protein DinB